MHKHVIYIDIGDRVMCNKCHNERVIDEAWLFSFGSKNQSNEWIIEKNKLCCSKCSEKGNITIIKLYEYEEIIKEIEKERWLQEISDYASRNAYPGKPYEPITKGAWWTSDEANFEDLVRRQIEEDIERNIRMDRE